MSRMFSWIFHRLPGPAWVRILLFSAVIIYGVVLAVRFLVPWTD